MNDLIPSLRKAYSEFARHPFIFVWPSLTYLALQVLFILAAVGLFLIYFLFASVIGIDTGLDAIQTKIAIGVIAIIFLFFSCGLNAGLARGFTFALERKKMSVADFFRYALQRSPVTFAIMLVRELIFLMFTGPFIGLFLYFQSEYEYPDFLVWILGLYIVFMMFSIHLLFTPAFLFAGSAGSNLFDSLRSGWHFLKRKHIMFFGLYFVFAVIWLLSFIPIIQLFMLFALYPIVYTAMIVMTQTSGKGGKSGGFGGFSLKLGAFIEPEEKEAEREAESD